MNIRQIGEMTLQENDEEEYSEGEDSFFEKVESEQNVRQDAVMEANREVKVLEVLQARLKKRAAQEELRREQGESDNAASRIGGEQ